MNSLTLSQHLFENHHSPQKMDFPPQSLQPPLGAAGGVNLQPVVPVQQPPVPPPQVAAALLDPDFEPQTRLRSNTWPGQRPEDNNNSSPCDGGGDQHQNQLLAQSSSPPDQTSTEHLMGQGGLLLPKKSSSRRNAWGNLSYADLITQAITSSPEKRLTLSQIYDWMVTNVPYFKDKGDSNSSAGWKNSIRHNLSLHNKFIRVQNEGTGKSSWWMLNPDAKPGKAARRRATSMETSKYEKRRGRIRKRIEALKNGTSVLDAPSPCSSLGEGLDVFPGSDESPSVLHSFSQLSPDFRPRANSNASSCGRLSPILGVNEPVIDLHDNQVPPMSPWNLDYVPFTSSANSYSNLSSSDRFGTEQLAGSLANTMKINDNGCFLPGAGQPTAVPATEFNNTPYVMQNFQQAQGSESTNTANTSFQSVGANGGASGVFVKLEPREHQQQEYYPNYNQLHDSKLQTIPSSSDLDFNIELGQFDCDVDEVLQTELNLGGDIDFNFGTAISNVGTTQTGPTTVSQLHNGGTMTLGNITTSGGASIQAHGTPTSLIHHHASNATPTSTSAFTNHQQAMVAGPAGQQWVH